MLSQFREALAYLGENLHEKTEKILFNISFPIHETGIQDNCNKVINDALKMYKGLVGPHQDNQ